MLPCVAHKTKRNKNNFRFIPAFTDSENHAQVLLTSENYAKVLLNSTQ